MTRQLPLHAALALLALSTTGVAAQQGDPALSVSVDSSSHEVVLRVGPFDLPSMTGMQADMGDDMMPAFSAGFEWPVEAMARGFTVSLRDSEGKLVSQRVLHHLNLVNYSRRQLLIPSRERIMGVGRETRNLMLPKSIGLPMAAGSRMKLNIMWHNESPIDIAGAMVTLRIKYSPANLLPVPTVVLPMAMDVADGPGRSPAFEVPPGRFTASREFIMPLDGRLLGVSGHLHDWGVALRLEEAASGKVLVTIIPASDSTGRITHMPIRLFGITGDGLKLHAGRHYRLVALYDNRTGVPVEGMGLMNAIFAPSDLGKWPDANSKATAYLDDGAYVAPTAQAPLVGSGHQHHHT